MDFLQWDYQWNRQKPAAFRHRDQEHGYDGNGVDDAVMRHELA